MNYIGTITSIAFFRGASNSYGMTLGQTISGSLLVDTSTPDQNLDPNILFRPNSIQSIQFQGFYAIATNISYSYFYLDASPSQDAVGAYANSISGSTSDVYEFSLTEPGPASILGTDEFNLVSLKLADFDPFGVNVFFQRATYVDPVLPEVTQFFARMDHLEVLSVPEAPTLALALLAIGCLAMSSTKIARASVPAGVERRVA